MSIELDMLLILKKAKQWEEQKEQEREFFGPKFAQFTDFMETYYPNNDDYLPKVLYEIFGNIHEGSDRIGVDQGDYFIKVARNPMGIELNKRESNILFNVFPKVYARDENHKWIMVEKARSFEDSDYDKFFPELTKHDLYLDDYFDSLDEGPMEVTEDMNRGERLYREENNRQVEIVKQIQPGQFLKNLLTFFHSYPQATSDMGNENLGVVIRSGQEFPVLIDAGLHGDLVPASTRGVKKRRRSNVH